MKYVSAHQVTESADTRLISATIRFRDNIRLTTYVISKFSDPTDAALDREDIIQAAHEGLWRACLSYDEESGYQFSTYAVPMIRGYIQNMMRDNEPVKTPRCFKDIRYALHEHGLSLPLTKEEIDMLASEGKFSKKQIEEYSEPYIISLDTPIRDAEGSGTYSDIIPDTNAEIDLPLTTENINYIIEKIASRIPARHRDIVREWLHAAYDGRQMIQRDLGAKYGYTQPTINKILRNMRDSVEEHGEEIRSLFGI